MDKYSQHCEQTAAGTVHEASQSLLQLGQHTLTFGSTNDEPNDLLIASRSMDQDPGTKSGTGMNEVVDRLSSSKSKTSDDPEEMNQKSQRGTDDKNEDPLKEVRNRLDGDIDASVKHSGNVFERMWHYRPIPMVSSEVRDKFASYIPPDIFTGYRTQPQKLSEVNKVPFVVTEYPKASIVNTVEHVVVPRVVTGYPKPSIVNIIEHVAETENTLENASKQCHDTGIILDSKKEAKAPSLQVHTVCSNSKFGCSDLSQVDVKEDMASKSDGKGNRDCLYDLSMIVPFKSISKSTEDSDVESRDNRESSESVSQEDARSIISTGTCSTDNQNQFKNENNDLRLVEHDAEGDMANSNIDFDGDRLNFCSEKGIMFEESSHTTDCSGMGVVIGESSHTSSCSEIMIVDERNYHTCGGCGQKFDHICKLHQHLIGHSSGGSYHYDNHIRTAFPKYDMVCKGMQTEEFNIPPVSRRRKRKSFLDNCDVPLLKKVPKQNNTQKTRVSFDKSSNSNANKLTETKASNIDMEDSQPRKKTDGSLCTNKLTEPDPDLVDEQDKSGEETIDSSVKGNGSSKIIARIQAELEDICGFKDDDGKRDSTGNNGSNFQNSVNDIHSEVEDNTTMYDINKVKIETPVFEELGEKIVNDSHEVNANVKQDRGRCKRIGKNKRKKCSVKKKIDSFQLITKPMNNTVDTFECKVCGQDFDTKRKMQIHIDKVHNKDSFQLITKRKKSIVDTFKCKICEQEFDKKRKMQMHITKVHSKDFPFTCITCSATFESNDELQKHRKVEHPGSVHACGLCGKVLSTKSMLEGHYRVHMGIKPFACDICVPKREFTRKTQLHDHMQTHSKEKNMQCEFCGKPFSARYLMINHVKHCGGIKPHQCDDCDMRFVSNFALKRHRRVHTGEKPYVCEVCAFACSTTACLTRHMRTHTGEKPYACPHCTKSFGAPSSLKKHLRIHTKERPYVCSFCSKAFTTRWNLKTHERQHTGKTPYKCSTCGMGFKQNVSLKAHIKSHCGKRQQQAVSQLDPTVHGTVDTPVLDGTEQTSFNAYT